MHNPVKIYSRVSYWCRATLQLTYLVSLSYLCYLIQWHGKISIWLIPGLFDMLCLFIVPCLLVSNITKAIEKRRIDNSLKNKYRAEQKRMGKVSPARNHRAKGTSCILASLDAREG